MRGFFAALVFWLLLLLVIGGTVAYSGWYDVSADRPHLSPTRSFLDWVVRRSVAVRSETIAVPKLDDEKRIASGARKYHEMCAPCHRAPGDVETPLRRGLNPKPPDFTRAKVEPRAAFWVVKHGLKMTGMPAWGVTHGDEELWDVVAFLERLASMDAAEYRELAAPEAAQGQQPPAQGDPPAAQGDPLPHGQGKSRNGH